MYVSLSAAGVNINELRRSLKLQEWLEKNARGGFTKHSERMTGMKFFDNYSRFSQWDTQAFFE